MSVQVVSPNWLGHNGFRHTNLRTLGFLLLDVTEGQNVSPISNLLQKDKILVQCHVIHVSTMAYMLQKDRMLVPVLVECYRSVSRTDRLTKLGFLILDLLSSCAIWCDAAWIYRQTLFTRCHWQSKSLEDGQTNARAFLSGRQSSVIVHLGPVVEPLLKNEFCWWIVSWKSLNASFNIDSVSHEVIMIPSDSPPATLGVITLKNLQSVLSSDPVESMKTMSPLDLSIPWVLLAILLTITA